MSKSVAIYFDMDGVLCDWVDAYKKVMPDLPLEKFNSMSKGEKDIIKDKIFGYDFFRDMKPIKKGVDMFKDYVSKGNDVYILSAVGDTKHIKEIEKAKKEWIKEYLGPKVKCFFVDKVENKSIKKLDGYSEHILIDDRKKAIDAWNKAGGIGILFI